MYNGDEVAGTLAVVVLWTLLIVAVVTDIRTRRIPNILLSPALSLALLIHVTTGGVDGLITAASGLALGILMLLPLYFTGGMGAGDVKLLGVVGSFLGPWGAVVAGFATMMAGAVIGLLVLVWRRQWRGTRLLAERMFGPRQSPSVGAAAVKLTRTAKQHTTIAYAPAIALGTIITLWYIGRFPGLVLG